MRILIALTYYRPHYSGLTIYAEREARALAARGHQVTILTSRFDNKLPSYERMDGVDVIRPKVWFHVSKGPIMPAMLLYAWKLARQADVIQLHLPQFDAAGIALLGRLLGKPVVLTYHCDLLLPSGLINRIANLVSNTTNYIAAQAANAIVHNTRDYAEASPFLSRYLDKVVPILPPGELTPVSAEEISSFRQKFNLERGQPTIGIVARLATEKGVEYLAEAMPIILEKYPQARVLFVGPYENVFGEEQYARQLAPLIQSLGEHWSFLGILSPVELSAFFHACDVTVLPSINSTESYGLVQVESMSCGTPGAASDRPGIRVPVRMTGMGQVFPPGNAQALAQALISILDHPEQYHRDPERLIQASSPEQVAKEYETLFEGVIAGARVSQLAARSEKQV